MFVWSKEWLCLHLWFVYWIVVASFQLCVYVARWCVGVLGNT